MVTIIALLVVQSSSLQIDAGVALAPGDRQAPVVRVARSWPVAPHFDFQLEGAFAMAGVDGSSTSCGITGQCFGIDVRARAQQLEIPALLTFSIGPVFVRGGPVFALRLTCDREWNGTTQRCPSGSGLSWGSAAGIGVRPRIGSRRLTLEARLQQFREPLVTVFTSDAGTMDEFRPRAVLLTVGWGR